jgi:hypothetical protein
LTEDRHMQPLIDVAARLKIDYQRLRNAAIRGEVASVRVKGRWWVDPADAERFKRGLSPAPAPAESSAR